MWVLFIAVAIGLFITIARYRMNTAYLLSCYRRGNTITYGRKGCGKDMLFNYVINHRKIKCFSNIQYNKKLTTLAEPSILNVDPNTYENFIEGKVVQLDKNPELEGHDYYLSDTGIYFPSQYNNLLDKKYKSMPIFMALSRHLYNMNVHANTQALDRPWIKLREQGDTYIHAVRTWTILGLVFVTKWRCYSNKESAQREIRPYRAGALSSKERKARQEEHRALYGEIVEGIIIQLRHQIKYDTRAFEKIVFKSEKNEGGGAACRAHRNRVKPRRPPLQKDKEI